MGNFVYNISKGRAAELYNRVDLNDPAASVLVVMILATAGVESDATLIDKDTFADVVSGATNEVTNGSYAKKSLTDADIVAFSPTDGSDWVTLDIPDQTWTGVAAGDGWNDAVIGYDYAGSLVMANIVPMTQHDFVVTPDGSDITLQIDAAGFFKAS